ncbi:MAG: alcohol dehydrogenase catalytic domain-containing protein [Acidimicrobiales bacterium]|nr:alcohol dehydrogenase catalytic domain-containing protein [Acidimicrobiales bacterium]
MQGLILEGTTEDSVRLSNDIEIVGDLEPRQVRVEIHAAGVCGSDLSCVHGKYYMPTPLVPGHEAAGKVVEVGSAVTYCAVGDHVILSTFSNCGHCPECEGGEPGNCRTAGLGGLKQPYAEGDQALYNFANLGAFVQETVVSENQCIPIPKELPLASASLIGCGVITGTGAVFNRAQVQLGDTVVVIGSGGVGLNVIQAAHLVGASQIIAIDRVPQKEALATQFGATDFVLAEGDDFDAVAAVKELAPGGVNHAFEVVGSPKLLADALNMTRPGGSISAVGVPDLTATVTYGFQALHQNKRLLGIRAGGARPRKDFPMLADLYMRGKLKLDEMISNTAGLDGIQDAFDALKTGAEARTVLLPHG